MNKEKLKNQCKKAMKFLFTVIKFALLYFCFFSILLICLFVLSDIDSYYHHYGDIHKSWQISLYKTFNQLSLVFAIYFLIRKKYILMFLLSLLLFLLIGKDSKLIPDMQHVRNVAICIDEPSTDICDNL